jgi:hypothetical protein
MAETLVVTSIYLEDVVDYLLPVWIRRWCLTWGPLQDTFKDSQYGLNLQLRTTFSLRWRWLDISFRAELFYCWPSPARSFTSERMKSHVYTFIYPKTVKVLLMGHHLCRKEVLQSCCWSPWATVTDQTLRAFSYI